MEVEICTWFLYELESANPIEEEENVEHNKTTERFSNRIWAPVESKSLVKYQSTKLLVKATLKVESTSIIIILQFNPLETVRYVVLLGKTDCRGCSAIPDFWDFLWAAYTG